MELSVNAGMKKTITKLVIQGTKKLRVLKTLSWISVLLGVAMGAIYCLINFLIPDFSTVKIQGVVTKNFIHIISTSALIIVVGAFIGAALYYLLKNLSGKGIEERVEESCLMTKESLLYSFRVKYHSAPTSKIVIAIPFKSIDSIQYETTLRKITIKGCISYSYYNNYKTDSKPENGTARINEWELYDYFSPSLYEALKTREIK